MTKLCSIFHLISRPDLLESCLTQIGDRDTILLLGEAVVLATNHIKIAIPILVLKSDFENSGLKSPCQARLIDFEEFVDLVIKHDLTESWI